MRIRINSTVLAPGGLAGPSGLTVGGREVVEEAAFFRALATTLWARGQRATDISFSVSRQHGSIRAAERHALTHYKDLPSTGNVVFTIGEGDDTESIALLGAVVEATNISYRGVSTSTTYSIRGGLITTETIPDGGEVDPEVTRRGTVSIGNGEMEVEVTFANPMTGTPTVVANVLMPSGGGDLVWATIQEDTISDSGFTASLSGPVGGSGYKLSYIAIL